MRNSTRTFYFIVFLCLSQFNTSLFGQCENLSAYGNGTAPTDNNGGQISNCNYANEFGHVADIVMGSSYVIVSSVYTDYITVYDEVDNLVGHGPVPYNFTASSAGTYEVHITANANCDGENACRETSIFCTSCGAVPGCTNSIADNYDADADYDDGSCIFPGLDHNECSGAVDLTEFMNTDGSCNIVHGTTNMDATFSFEEGSPSAGCTDADLAPLDVWYSLTVPSTGSFTFQFNLTPGFSALVELYTGTCGNLTAYTPITCNSLTRRTYFGLEAGSTVYLRVWDFGSDDFGNFEFCLTEEIPGCTDSNAENFNPLATADDGSCDFGTTDKVCNSVTLIVNDACVVGDNTDMNVELGEPQGDCFLGINKTVWFNFVATSSFTTITTDFDGYTSNDTEIAIYNVSDCSDYSTFNHMDCDQDGGDNVNYNAILANLVTTIGETYYVQVSGYNGTVGSFCIQAKSPPNNDGICNSASLACGDMMIGNTGDYFWNTDHLPFGNCTTGTVSSPNAFYKITGTGDDITLSLCGSDFDTKLDVYCLMSGTCADIPIYTCLDGNDDSPTCSTGIGSKLTFPTLDGTDYYVMIHAPGDITGNFELSVTCTEADLIPTNQDCENSGTTCRPMGTAQEITFASTCNTISGTNINASKASVTPNCAISPSAEITDVWYSFTTGENPTDYILDIQEGTAIDARFAIFAQCGGVTNYCNDPIISGMSPNTEYFIQVFTEVGNEGTFEICLMNAVEPGCTSISSPSGNDVAVDAMIEWNIAGGAEGYKLAIGTSEGATDFMALTDVGNVTSFSPANFDFNETYYISLVPYNEMGEITTCPSASFSTACPLLNVSINEMSDETCAGYANGLIDIAVNGGVGPYQYLWTGPNEFSTTGSQIVELKAGEYFLTITDMDNSCIFTDVYLINQAIPMNASSFVTHGSCGVFTSIDLSVEGGQEPYSYTWSNGSGSQDLEDIPVGTYSVIILDANGCDFLLDEIEVNNFQILDAVADVNAVNCTNSLASISIDALNGSGPYFYTWASSDNSITGSHGDESNSYTIVGLEDATYSVTVTDVTGCEQIFPSLLVEYTEGISVDYDILGNACSMNDGSITIDIGGGTPPYEISWGEDNSLTTMENLVTIENLSPGMYELFISEANACSENSGSLEVPLNVMMNIELIELIDINCGGLTSASIDIEPIGQGVFEYEWMGPNAFTANTQDIDGIEGGNYLLKLTNTINGCVIFQSFMVEESTPILADFAIENASCMGDGMIDLTIEGGQAPYTFEWSNGGDTEDIANLNEGTYHVTVTDAAECELTLFSIPISSSSVLLTEIQEIVHVTCEVEIGSVSLAPVNGTGPYTYTWLSTDGEIEGSETTEENSYTIDNLPISDYEIAIADANGCASEMTLVSVEYISPLVLTISSTNIACGNAASGLIQIDIEEGLAPYNVAWSNGNISTANETASLVNIMGGDYNATITDAIGCTAVSEMINIDDSALMGLQFNELVGVDCYSYSDGAINISVLGGQYPFTYQWSNGSLLSDLQNIPAGPYFVTVTDVNGCVYESDTITVGGPEQTIQVIDEYVAGVTCFGDEDGEIIFDVIGGTPPYTYHWSTGETGVNFMVDLSAGQYRCTVIDANGCADFTSAITITEASESLSLETIATPTTVGQSNGTASANATGGVEPFEYMWDENTNNQNTQTAVNLAQGTYSVTIVDANGCSTESTVDVENTTGLAILEEGESITLFPNPTNGLANLAFDFNEISDVKIEVFSVIGQQIFTMQKEKVKTGKVEVDLQNFAEGVYMVRLTLNNQDVLTKRLLVNRYKE